VLIAAAIVLTAGTGTWGLLNHHQWTGWLMLVASILLVVYGAYAAGKAQELRLK
jgi:hypothetical protein